MFVSLVKILYGFWGEAATSIRSTQNSLKADHVLPNDIMSEKPQKTSLPFEPTIWAFPRKARLFICNITTLVLSQSCTAFPGFCATTWVEFSAKESAKRDAALRPVREKLLLGESITGMLGFHLLVSYPCRFHTFHCYQCII